MDARALRELIAGARSTGGMLVDTLTSIRNGMDGAPQNLGESIDKFERLMGLFLDVAEGHVEAAEQLARQTAQARASLERFLQVVPPLGPAVNPFNEKKREAVRLLAGGDAGLRESARPFAVFVSLVEAPSLDLPQEDGDAVDEFFGRPLTRLLYQGKFSLPAVAAKRGRPRKAASPKTGRGAGTHADAVGRAGSPSADGAGAGAAPSEPTAPPKPAAPSEPAAPPKPAAPLKPAAPAAAAKRGRSRKTAPPNAAPADEPDTDAAADAAADVRAAIPNDAAEAGAAVPNDAAEAGAAVPNGAGAAATAPPAPTGAPKRRGSRKGPAGKAGAPSGGSPEGAAKGPTEDSAKSDASVKALGAIVDSAVAAVMAEAEPAALTPDVSPGEAGAPPNAEFVTEQYDFVTQKTDAPFSVKSFVSEFAGRAYGGRLDIRPGRLGGLVLMHVLSRCGALTVGQIGRYVFDDVVTVQNVERLIRNGYVTMIRVPGREMSLIALSENGLEAFRNRKGRELLDMVRGITPNPLSADNADKLFAGRLEPYCRILTCCLYLADRIAQGSSAVRAVTELSSGILVAYLCLRHPWERAWTYYAVFDHDSGLPGQGDLEEARGFSPIDRVLITHAPEYPAPKSFWKHNAKVLGLPFFGCAVPSEGDGGDPAYTGLNGKPIPPRGLEGALLPGGGGSGAAGGAAAGAEGEAESQGAEGEAESQGAGGEAESQGTGGRAGRGA